MGIKNIHIGLILTAILLSFIFGFWGINHQFQALGLGSLISSVGLIFYGISFLKKAKTL